MSDVLDLSCYRGVVWREGVKDCWWLVRDFYGRFKSIALPRICVRSGDPLVVRRQFVSSPVRSLFERLAVPVHGCVVEFSRAHFADHVGVYLVVNGEPCVLHNEQESGVCVTPWDEMLMAYSPVGFYQYVG